MNETIRTQHLAPKLDNKRERGRMEVIIYKLSSNINNNISILIIQFSDCFIYSTNIDNHAY